MVNEETKQEAWYILGEVHDDLQDFWDNGNEIVEDEDGMPFIIVHSHNDIELFEKVLINYLSDYIEEDEIDSKMCELFDSGFSDEYSYCIDCRKIIRIIPDRYGWTPQYYLAEGEGFVCLDCFNKDSNLQEYYIESLINDSGDANTLLTHKQLESMGFKKLDEMYESGYHEGMNDNPKEIFNKLKDEYNEIIFNIYENSQFYTIFNVYVR